VGIAFYYVVDSVLRVGVTQPLADGAAGEVWFTADPACFLKRNALPIKENQVLHGPTPGLSQN